jgi:hypothetical protein
VSIRFLSDADINDFIVSGVMRREPAIDFLTAHAAGIEEEPDLKVPALAASANRILISHDVNTMPDHFWDFRKAETRVPGSSSCRKAWI